MNRTNERGAHSQLVPPMLLIVDRERLVREEEHRHVAVGLRAGLSRSNATALPIRLTSPPLPWPCGGLPGALVVPPGWRRIEPRQGFYPPESRRCGQGRPPPPNSTARPSA